MRRATRALVFGLCLAASGLGVGLSWAAAAGLGHVVVKPEARSVRVGEVLAFALHDGEVVRPNDGKTFGLKAGAAAVDEVLKAAGAPPGVLMMSHDALLVKISGRVILIDTGEGQRVSGALLPSLALVGVRPEDVTDVFLTHGDQDHAGGLADLKGAPVFPKAVVHIAAAEWAYMQAGGKPKTELVDGAPLLLTSEAVVAAIRPQVETFEPGAELLPGLRAVPLVGHAPGHVGYEIASKGERLLVVGDAVHSVVVSLARPDWPSGYDKDPVLGAQTRRRLLDQLAQSGELIFSPHFPFPGFGRITVKGEGFAWVPATTQGPRGQGR